MLKTSKDDWAARFVNICCDNNQGTVTNLVERRDTKENKYQDLQWYQMVVNNQTALVLPAHNTPTERLTRKFHSQKCITLGAKTNTCKYSFVSRTLSDCNKLAATEQKTAGPFTAHLLF